MADLPASTAEVTDLIQHLIRNACVNDGTAGSGGEVRNVDVIEAYLEGSGIDLQRYESAPGRTSLVGRIEGTDPAAPSLLLLGHTDVVPVSPERWEHDPFGGELIDGEVWGRGAIDMLNLTSSMAYAMKRFARTNFRPTGTLIYCAVADEEAGGEYGAEHLIRNEPDAVLADYVITESGGFPMPAPEGVKLPALTAERGTLWSTIRVHGTPSHGSMPFRTDNALVKAAEVVRRISEYHSPTRIDAAWKDFVAGLGLPDEMAAPLLREEGFVETAQMLPVGMSRMAYSCTHTTMAPTVMRTGTKLNVIPASVEIELDIRTLPGDGPDEVEAMLDEALGDLADSVEFVPGRYHPATVSPTQTPLWDALERVGRRFYEGSAVVPIMMPGATDSRFFRRAGSVAYGFGLFSQKLSLDDLASMGHGDNERIDLESLGMVTEMWDVLVRDFLG